MSIFVHVIVLVAARLSLILQIKYRTQYRDTIYLNCEYRTPITRHTHYTVHITHVVHSAVRHLSRDQNTTCGREVACGRSNGVCERSGSERSSERERSGERANTWFPALRFRSSVQTESSSIFPVPAVHQAWSPAQCPLGSAGNSPASPLGLPGCVFP